MAFLVTAALLALAAVAAGLLALAARARGRSRPSGLGAGAGAPADTKSRAPGPRPWPLLGSLHLLGKHDVPFQALSALSRVYGDIYAITLGSTPCVVVNSFDLIREVLISKGAHFGGRPDFMRFHALFGGDRNNSLALCDWSELQKTRRSIARMYCSPRTASAHFDALAVACDAEAARLLRAFDARVAAAAPCGGAVRAKPLLQMACANIFTGYMCSTSFDYDDPAFQHVNGEQLRRDLLGNQPGLRRGLPAVAAAGVQLAPAQDPALGQRDPHLHHGAHHRAAARGDGGRGRGRGRGGGRRATARLHRGPAAPPRRRPGPQLGARHLRAGGLRGRPLGRGQPGVAAAGRGGQGPARHGARARGGRRGHRRRRAPARRLRPRAHALHRRRHPRDAARRLLAHRAARLHAGHRHRRLRGGEGHRGVPQQLRAEHEPAALARARALPARALPVGRRHARRQARLLHPVQHGQAHVHRPAPGAEHHLPAGRRPPAALRRVRGGGGAAALAAGVRRAAPAHLPARLPAARLQRRLIPAPAIANPPPPSLPLAPLRQMPRVLYISNRILERGQPKGTRAPSTMKQSFGLIV